MSEALDLPIRPGLAFNGEFRFTDVKATAHALLFHQCVSKKKWNHLPFPGQYQVEEVDVGDKNTARLQHGEEHRLR
jgi:hypothetical protein